MGITDNHSLTVPHFYLFDLFIILMFTHCANAGNMVLHYVQYCFYFLLQCSGAVMFTDLSFYRSLTSSFFVVAEILTILLFQQKCCMHSLCFVAKLVRLHCRGVRVGVI